MAFLFFDGVGQNPFAVKAQKPPRTSQGDRIREA